MRILIAENDFLTRQDLQKGIEKLGYEIIPAANGSEAWQIYQRETVKMVVTGWIMPQMDGLTLCRNIRQLNKDFYTYIIFITAEDCEQDLVSVFDSGADDYIIKPFNPEELRVRLATGERIIELEEEHKSLVNILRESRNKFRAVFDSLQEEIVSVDRKNNIISLNKSFLKGRGDKFSQVVGKNLFRGVELDQDPGNIRKIQKAIIKVFENSENIFLNNISSDITGEKIFKEVNCLPICNNSGDVIQVAIVSRDVTEERKKTEQIQNLNLKLQEAVEDGKIKNKKLEETLQHLKETQAQILQSEKMSSIGQLAAGIAHEINNPTGFVSSNLKTLSGYYKDMEGLIARYRNLVKNIQEENHKIDIPGSIKEQSQKIMTIEEEIDLEYILDDIKDIITECREGTERIKKIVLDLKDFAHPGEDKIMEADINKGLESTLNVVWNELKYKAVVHKEYGELPMVKCYPQQLNQVFMNILVNAGQAIEKQGEIKITTGTEDGHAVISISDTGIGIPEENLIKIFDPFFTTKEIRKGTGLGMNVAYNIIKKHQGSIDVESEVGRGTTFKIKIPLEETAS